jgi:hypothetical protein
MISSDHSSSAWLFEEYAKGSRSVSGDLVRKPAAQRKKPEF